MQGKLIVIEGLDGSGKSTQIELLKAHYEAQGIKHQFVHFPKLNKGVYGRLIAEFLRGEFGGVDEVHPKLVALLFANDRKEHIHQIEKWLADGCVVLADRYVFSNIAFQCAKLKDEKEKVILKDWILEYEFEFNRLPKPFITFFLDVPFHNVVKSLSEERTGDERNYLDGKKDIHEGSLDLQKSVYEEYINLIGQQDNFYRVDCKNAAGEMLSREEVSSKIIERIGQ